MLSRSGGIVSMVAHEIIHTQQFDHRRISFGSNPLLEQTMKEGIADFLTFEILGRSDNSEMRGCNLLYSSGDGLVID